MREMSRFAKSGMTPAGLGEWVIRKRMHESSLDDDPVASGSTSDSAW